jgi:hypothetical protein
MALQRIPERFLRSIWQKGELFSSPLVTSDGARVAVLSPGVINAGGGPDFTNALIRIGGVLFRGDVELHVRASSWNAHRHSADPHYNRVILHVAVAGTRSRAPQRTASGRRVPLLLLSPFLDPILFDRWVHDSRRPARLCNNRDRVLPAHLLRARLRVLGLRRIGNRVRSLGTRLEQIIGENVTGEAAPLATHGTSGAWDQILYECLLEGMGYASNRSSFLALARSVPLSLLKAHGLGNTRRMQALLFGGAGLLPPVRTLPDPESRSYVRRLRRIWHAHRGPGGAPAMAEGEWMFFRMRPANFPTARLAAFCFLLPSFFAGRPLCRILDIAGRSGTTPRVRRRALEAMFRISPEGYWAAHLHFRPVKGRGGIVALGRSRVHELIVNGIVPILLLRARLGADRRLRSASLLLLSAGAGRGDNSVTRLVNAALTGRRNVLGSPLEQQGILHMYRLYCSRGRCTLCPVRPRRRRRTPPDGARAVRTSRRCLPARTSSSPRR